MHVRDPGVAVTTYLLTRSPPLLAGPVQLMSTSPVWVDVTTAVTFCATLGGPIAFDGLDVPLLDVTMKVYVVVWLNPVTVQKFCDCCAGWQVPPVGFDVTMKPVSLSVVQVTRTSPGLLVASATGL